MPVSIEEARSSLLASLPGPRSEHVAIEAAVGRYLAADIHSSDDMPPADRSAMDGFAVRAMDLASVPADLRLVGEVAAGSTEAPVVEQGSCARIFTGANLPPGADAVAIVESTNHAGEGVVRFMEQVKPGSNVRRRGDDCRAGALVLRAGSRLGPQQIAACAAVGADPVPVYRVPRVGVLVTGAEIRKPSDRVAAHETRNSNGPAVMSALRELGIVEPVPLGVADDVMERLIADLRSGLESCDVVIVTGGVSMGDRDLVPRAVEAVGGRIVLHKVRMKPGKPFLFATAGTGKVVFGLPGNPVSVLVSFWEFVAPAVIRMMGGPGTGPWAVSVRLAEEASARGDRTLLMPSRMDVDASGGLVAVPIRIRSSADLISASRANGVVKLEPEHGPYAAGSSVEAHPWSRPW